MGYHLYVESKTWHKWTYLQNRNRLTDTEKRSVIAKGDGGEGQTGTLGFSSVQFSHSVVSDSLRPHESQHARPPCPSPTPGIHPDARPSSEWCHPAISSSGVPFSSCPQSLPASESFPMSQLFTWGGQSTAVSFSFSIIPSKEIPGLISFRMDWLDLLAVQGTLKSLLNTTVQKHQFFGTQPSSQSNSDIHTRPQEKP